MSVQVFFLLVTVFGFAALVWFVYAPSRRERLERLGHIPLDNDAQEEQE